MTTPEIARFALAFLGTYALHSTLLLALVWALCTRYPSLAPRLRERLWRLGLVGGLLTAGGQLLLGTQPILGGIVLRPEPKSAAQDHAPRPRLSNFAPDRRLESEKITAPAVEGTREARNRPSAQPLLIRSTPVRTKRSEERGFKGKDGPPRIDLIQPALGPADPAGIPVAIEPRLRESALPPREEAPPALLGSARRLAGRIAEPSTWPALVGATWAAAGGLLVLGVLASWSAFRRRLLGRRRLVDGPLVAKLEELRRRAGLRAHIRLSVCDRISSPISLGFFRPEICIPSAVQSELTAPQQETLLAHEIAHHRRGDPAWFGFYCLLEKLFFFQPLNRLARKRLQELAEESCDDWAVRWTGERLALASCLTEVAQWIVGARARELAFPGLSSNRSKLGQRVERLLDDRRSPAVEKGVRWGLPLFLGVAGLFVLAVPGISASASPREVSSRTEPAQPSPTLAAPQAESPARSAVAAEPPAPPPPAPLTAPVDAAPAEQSPAGVASDHELLEEEMHLLETEFDELKHELALSELHERFSRELELIEQRMHELRARRERVGALLARLTSQEPASDPKH